MTPPAVLVAEDSLVIRAVLVEQLQSRGYRVIEAGDGEQALAACRREQPDVVLLDVEMPHLDGHGVLAQIKADPRLADIPVVFVTSRVTTEDVVDGLRLGAHDYLRKPFEPSELLARVHAAVRNKALQDELRLRNAELELASRTDALTGLRNRRHLEEQLQRLAATGDPLSVLLCDIDRFKQVNDTRGHAAGDQVLRVVATRLGEVARPGDVPGRWGRGVPGPAAGHRPGGGGGHGRADPAGHRGRAGATGRRAPDRDDQRRGGHRGRRRLGMPGPAGRHRPVRGQGGRPRPGGRRPASRARGRVANLHTGRPRCGKIPMTGSGPTRHRETGIRLADQQVIGKVGRVTGTIGPERVGEVMIPIRGGSEAFNAYAADTKDTISTGTRVVVIEYFPPRTVVVSPM
jgi:two-component system, cell cycle response regulator